MRVSEIARSVLYSVGANKFRVMLTSLGIIIGSFTIIMVVGIGKAGEDSVSEQYKRLSVETITISRGGGVMMTRGGATSSQTTLSKQQALDMEELEHVKSVGISVSTQTTLAYGQTSETVTVMGINEAYAEITHLDIAAGEFFTDSDGKSRAKVCALGYNAAAALFGEDWESAVGETVKLKGLSFTVVGVIARIGGSAGLSSGAGRPGGGSSSPDDMAYVPYDVAVKYTTGGSVSGDARMAMSASGSASYVALANDISSVGSAITEIQDYIYDITGSDAFYTVTDAGSVLSSALQTANTMGTLLIAVAAIVMIVSGIGIMNVLMVSVKERVREIGILKSIGASRFIILMEFMLEAVFISVAGGALGIALSWFAPNVLAFFDIAFSPSAAGLALGFCFSAVTGVFFGFYPAWKASRLKPIEALNDE
ncbi:MAG: ABC transporter permease [Clostridiales bacterium]|jgi:putative ABC transport system permease protein|nr:ABC transporter permease [Clostridiales bacterium]